MLLSLLRRMPETDITLEALVGVAALEGITFFGISAVRSEPGVATPEPGQVTDIAPMHTLETALRDDDAGFRARFRTDIDVHIGTVSTDVAVEYLTGDVPASTISQDVLLDFVNHVAVMTTFPYIRQAVSDITQRVFGSALLLPMVQRGEIDFSLRDGPVKT